MNRTLLHSGCRLCWMVRFSRLEDEYPAGHAGAGPFGCVGFAASHWKDRLAWKISASRLLVAPVLTLALFCLVPSSFYEVKMTLLIAASTPVGAMLLMLQNMLGQTSKRASGLIILSTLCSLVSIPLILGLASLLWRAF